MKRILKSKARFVKDLVNFAPRIVVPLDLEDLPSKVSPAAMAKLQKICDEELGPNQPAQAASGIWVTQDKQTILAAYFGQRLLLKEKPRVRVLFPHFRSN